MPATQSPSDDPAADLAAVRRQLAPDDPAADLAAVRGQRPQAMNFAIVNGQRVPIEPTWTDRAVEALPAIGGMAGGIIGGIGGTVGGFGVGGVPGAVGGATLGGAAGEAGRQLVERWRGQPAPTTPTEAAGGIATEGAIQGAMELAGAGVMAGARGIGRSVMENAIRPTMTLAREFPNLVETAIKERLPVGRLLPGMKTGTQQAAEKLVESARKTQALLSQAGQMGVSFDAGTVVAKPVAELAADIAKQPIAQADEKRLAGLITQFLKEKATGPISPTTLKELKQAAQSLATPVYKAQRQGFPVSAAQSLNARFNKAVATGAKTALETIPDVGASEARTQSLIGARRALQAAQQKRAPLWAELAATGVGAGTAAAVGTVTGGDIKSSTGSGIAVTMLSRALLSPRSMSRIALGLTNDQIQQFIRQIPRTLLLSILEATVTKHSPEGKTTNQ